jgi:hypothetical protein
MNEKFLSSQKHERERSIAQDRKTILNLNPEKALESLAKHPYPVTLIQSMAEEDFYFLVHHIGPEDALPVIAVASNQQWEYLLDLEVWEKDHINSHHMTQWLSRLRKADSDRFTHWIANEKQEEITFYLFQNIELHIREYDQDPGEIVKDFFTEDQTHYIRMRPYPKEEAKKEEERDLFIKDLLNRMSVYDQTLYRDFLLASDTVIPAEAEEEMYRLRNVRLAEKGMLPFDEAIGVYQPLKPGELPLRSPKTKGFQGRIVETYPLPIHTGSPTDDANLFTQTLAQIHDETTLQKLQAEFAGLCNQVIAADQIHIREKKNLSNVVKKVGGYISIGLEKSALESEKPTPYIHADLIQNHLLSDIFRVGYGCALALKWRAVKWHRASWADNQGLPISFWGERFLGPLGGLLIKRPLYYDNFATDVLYREFACLEDIDTTEIIINHIIAFDDLLSLMNIEIEPFEGEDLLTYENLLLTLWANYHLNITGKPNSFQPLDMEQFGRFFDELWLPGRRPRKISDTMKELFLGWLAHSSGLPPDDISQRMAPALENLFFIIENELGSVEKENLDKRFIRLFLFKGQA